MKAVLLSLLLCLCSFGQEIVPANAFTGALLRAWAHSGPPQEPLRADIDWSKLKWDMFIFTYNSKEVLRLGNDGVLHVVLGLPVGVGMGYPNVPIKRVIIEQPMVWKDIGMVY